MHKFMKVSLGLLVLTGLSVTAWCGYHAITTVTSDVSQGTVYLVGMIVSLGISVSMLLSYLVGFGFLDATKDN